MNVSSSRPVLVEPGIRCFLNETLRQCHILREKYKNAIFNVGLFVGFVAIVSAFLIYKYKGKPTEQELAEREQKKKEYILSKIRMFQEEKLRAQQHLITGLPVWDLY